MDLAGVVDGTGACIIEQAGPPSWSKVTIAANAPSSAAAQWKIGIGKNGKIIHLLSFGAGPTCGAGPYTLAPGESIVIIVSGGASGDQINGTMYGVQELDPTKLTMDTPGTSIPPPPTSSTVAPVFQKRAIAIGSGTAAVILGTFHAGTTLTIRSIWADMACFAAASASYAQLQLGILSAGVGIWDRGMGVQGNIGDHDHISLENYSMILQGSDNFGGNVFAVQFDRNAIAGMGQFILVEYSTSFGTPV